ncbi:MAG: hypothetical protein GF331_09505 [Chitinivibrionales bacterium]|nr:hypothetical protein [Chitinivibrionales bacterium]
MAHSLRSGFLLAVLLTVLVGARGAMSATTGSTLGHGTTAEWREPRATDNAKIPNMRFGPLPAVVQHSAGWTQSPSKRSLVAARADAQYVLASTDPDSGADVSHDDAPSGSVSAEGERRAVRTSASPREESLPVDCFEGAVLRDESPHDPADLSMLQKAPCDSACQAEVRSRRRGSLVTVPNPTAVTTRRVPAGEFFATHAPNGFAWVQEDRAGTLIRVTLSEVPPGTKLRCRVGVHDMVGNLVAASRGDQMMLPQDRVLDIYWNGTNERGYPVQTGVYRVVVLIGVDAGAQETVWYKGYASVGIRNR